ncbi:PspC domain-containing protein [Methylococcus sp. EFPC2]|nr:PspC domain-containing protein [Methylococcus sp. EFPC2]QSA95609.1 PspC domain-containing protein [Methylococcus sp. EFPC2]
MITETRRLERDLDGRQLGGVCSGLARYFGVNTGVVRLLFLLSIAFSFSLTLWVYFVLWALLPVRKSPLAGVSWRLRRRVRHLDRLIEASRERLSRGRSVAVLENIHTLVLALLPDFDRWLLYKEPELSAAKTAALKDLPRLLEQYLRLPIPRSVEHGSGNGWAAEEALVRELERLESVFQQAVEQRFHQPLAGTATFSPSDPEPDGELRAIRKSLANLERRIAGRVDPPVLAKLSDLRETLIAALSRLGKTADIADPNVYNLRQIALEYLPDAVEKYLALPGELSRSEPLARGGTAQDVLSEQFDVLDDALRKMLVSLYRDDAQGLLVHGRFLRDKFVDQPIDWTRTSPR